MILAPPQYGADVVGLAVGVEVTDLLDAQVVRHGERFVRLCTRRDRDEHVEHAIEAAVRCARGPRSHPRPCRRSYVPTVLYTVATCTCLDTAETRGKQALPVVHAEPLPRPPLHDRCLDCGNPQRRRGLSPSIS
jgi:hypothetical protein